MNNTRLINPWVGLADRPPYLLDIDRGAHDEFVRKNSRKTEEDRVRFELHTELLPSPFIGNPLAPVVLLNLNPGFSPLDDRDYARADFRQAVLDNLVHRRTSMPFFPIAKEFSSTATYKWWDGHLAGLINATSREQVGLNVLCVQRLPYHSKEFSAVVGIFPSQNYTLQLVEDAMSRGAAIVGMRSRATWLATVPGLSSYERLSWLKNPRNPTISAGNLDGRSFASLVEAVRTH